MKSGTSVCVVGLCAVLSLRCLCYAPSSFCGHTPTLLPAWSCCVVDVVSLTQAPTLTCTRDDTLASVIEKLHATRVHRLYVIAGKDDLVGVISLRDVISIFVEEPEGYFDDSGAVAMHVHDTIRRRRSSEDAAMELEGAS